MVNLPGGRYHNVTTSCEYVWLGTLLALAKPKSASFNSPISLINKFCGFTSLCSTRRLWQYDRPRSNWNKNNRTFRCSKPPACRSMYCDKSVFWNEAQAKRRDRDTLHSTHRHTLALYTQLSRYESACDSDAIHTTYSKTKVNVSRVWTISCSVTMFECFSSFNSDASRIAVNGAPSSSCSLISFSATTWLVKLFGENGKTNSTIHININGWNSFGIHRNPNDLNMQKFENEMEKSERKNWWLTFTYLL